MTRIGLIWLAFSAFLKFSLLVLSCDTDDNCSLNGVCTKSRSKRFCKCDPGWWGDDCGRLDLAPATRWTGYNYTNITNPSYYRAYGNSSWGGTIIQDRDEQKLFHLVISQFANGCGLSGWRPHSFVIRAESRTGPQGPYHYAQNLTRSFRHNPYVFWSPADQKYLLYTIGVDAPEATLSSCKSVSKDNWPNNISVSAADDIRGPWSPFEVLVNGTNPAPWPLWSRRNRSSEIILASEDLKIRSADRYDGDYGLISTAPWNTSDYQPYWTEDPFLWRDKRGNWHALNHWMIDIVESGVKYSRVGAHMYARSITGPWHFKLQEAFNSTVNFTDGTFQTLNRRERPKIFFDDDMTPLYLINGVQDMNITSKSYTLIQPIGTRWKIILMRKPSGLWVSITIIVVC
ncbi:hypothetical protein EDB80DRAFT_778779 [Ilyonectria destructans]|nr:hypothetical protein EDB80DRAFT_778779 [Ilyonectria destructans]